MKYLTLNQAAKQARKSKAALLESLNNGTLSGNKNNLNQWQIDPAELFRVYPENWLEEPKIEPQKPPKTAETLAELLEIEKREREREREILRESLEKAEASHRREVERLEETIERERQQADHWRQQATNLLTHQPEPAPNPPEKAKQPKKRGFLGIFRKS